MILPSSAQSNLIRDWIPILFVFTFVFVFVAISALQIETRKMKVHPVSTKRKITDRDGGVVGFEIGQSLALMDGVGVGNAQKKLRRLPHVFSKVLELPFRSDADVSVEESSDCLRFIAEIGDGVDGVAAQEVRAHAVEILPGVTKIVIRAGDLGGVNRGGNGGVVELLLDQLEVDVWRFRLPATAQPDMATAVFVDGELIVTVPKDGQGQVEDGRDVWGGMARLVLVQ